MTLDLARMVSREVETLQAAGVPAASSAADLPGPGVLVQAPDLDFGFGGQITALHRGLVLAGGLDRTAALAQIGPILADAARVLSVTVAEAVDVPGVDAAGPAPGYRIRWSRKYMPRKENRR